MTTATGAPRFAIAIPQFVSDAAFDPDGLRGFLGRAEALGFESGWVGEQVIGSMPLLGPIEAMTWAAACTTRMRLGCAMLVSTLYSPLHLAKSLSTLDQLSRGRLEVGVVSGGAFRMFPAFGADRDGFISRFTEGLELVQACWTRQRVDFDGRFWRLRGVAMEPKPFQKPRPPLWLGGSHPAAVRRAVRLGDGFFGAGSSTTAAFAEQVGVVRAELEVAGRDPASFRLAKRVYVDVDDDAARARSRVAEGLDRLYGYFGVTGLAPVAVAGTPEDCARGLAEVAAAGAQLILLNPLADDAEQMERLAAQVLPHVL